MMRLVLPACCLFLANAAFAASQQPVVPLELVPPPTLVEGTWVTDLKSEITITRCDVGQCGVLSKIVVPPEIYQANAQAIDALGVENFTDVNNPDPLLRDRPMLGLQIVTLLIEKSPLEYEGEVYNPEDGKTYFGKIEVLDPNHIRLTGCGFFNLVCKSEDWTRAEPEVSSN